ncbi:hypothetical protein Tco_0189855 [Tanacetum coccineum]
MKENKEEDEKKRDGRMEEKREEIRECLDCLQYYEKQQMKQPTFSTHGEGVFIPTMRPAMYSHAHIMLHLESLQTISLDNLCLDNLDIFGEDLENQSCGTCGNESDSAGVRLLHRRLNLHFKRFNLRRISLTGFPAQSVRSSTTDALDSSYLLVLVIRTSQSRHRDKSKSDSYCLSD